MNMEINEYQKMLRDSAREFFTQEIPLAKTRSIIASRTGMSMDLWKKMARLGWLGMVIPENYGGAGGDFLDMVVLLVEMGRAYAPSPYLPTILLGALPLIEHGSEEQKNLYLPKIARGDSLFTMAIVEGNGKYNPESWRTILSRNGNKLSIKGNKFFVPYGEAANSIICVAKDKANGNICLTIINEDCKGLSRSAMETETHEFYAQVTFDDVILKPHDLLATFKREIEFRTILSKAAVARCAQIVGLAEHILNITVEYAKQRVQFEKQIGSFQAIQHHCANMLTELDGCRLLTYEASWRISKGLPYAMESAMAKAWCSESFKRIVALAHQVHGGVGLVEDHELPLYYRSAWSMASLFGSSDYHHENVARAIEESDTLFEPFPLVEAS